MSIHKALLLSSSYYWDTLCEKPFILANLLLPTQQKPFEWNSSLRPLQNKAGKLVYLLLLCKKPPPAKEREGCSFPVTNYHKAGSTTRPNNKHTQPLKCQEQINALLPSPDRRDPRDGLYLIHEIWASGTGFSLPAAVAFLLGEQELCYLIPLDLFHLLIPSHWLPKVLFFFFSGSKQRS